MHEKYFTLEQIWYLSNHKFVPSVSNIQEQYKQIGVHQQQHIA